MFKVFDDEFVDRKVGFSMEEVNRFLGNSSALGIEEGKDGEVFLAVHVDGNKTAYLSPNSFGMFAEESCFRDNKLLLPIDVSVSFQDGLGKLAAEWGRKEACDRKAKACLAGRDVIPSFLGDASLDTISESFRAVGERVEDGVRSLSVLGKRIGDMAYFNALLDKSATDRDIDDKMKEHEGHLLLRPVGGKDEECVRNVVDGMSDVLKGFKRTKKREFRHTDRCDIPDYWDDEEDESEHEYQGVNKATGEMVDIGYYANRTKGGHRVDIDFRLSGKDIAKLLDVAKANSAELDYAVSGFVDLFRDKKTPLYKKLSIDVDTMLTKYEGTDIRAEYGWMFGKDEKDADKEKVAEKEAVKRKPLTAKQKALAGAIEKWAKENDVRNAKGYVLSLNRKSKNLQASLNALVKQAKAKGFGIRHGNVVGKDDR